jgi:hypothetical protein
MARPDLLGTDLTLSALFTYISAAPKRGEAEEVVRGLDALD